jgi:hypothetical protein
MLADHRAANTDDATRQPGSTEPARSRARRRWFGGLTTLAAAAALLLLWVRPPGDHAGRTTNAVDELPSYTLTVRNHALMATRAAGDAQEVARYLPDSRVNWVLSPEASFSSPLAVVILAAATAPSAHESRLLPVAPTLVQRSADGALSLRGRIDELLPLPAGRWSLQLIVGPRAALPTSVEEARARVTEDPRGAPVRVVTPVYELLLETETSD